MMETLESIKSMIQKGNRKGAFEQLCKLLRSYGNNKDAWWLLLALVDKPRHKQDCYQNILRIDPTDKVAKKHLETLWKVDTGELTLEYVERTNVKRCPTCSGDLEIHLIGELKDNWNTCPYCKAKIDTPPH